jgi:hypothetical protein
MIVCVSSAGMRNTKLLRAGKRWHEMMATMAAFATCSQWQW